MTRKYSGNEDVRLQTWIMRWGALKMFKYVGRAEKILQMHHGEVKALIIRKTRDECLQVRKATRYPFFWMLPALVSLCSFWSRNPADDHWNQISCPSFHIHSILNTLWKKTVMTVVFICNIFGKQNISFFCPFSCVPVGRHVISLTWTASYFPSPFQFNCLPENFYC